MSSYDTYHTYSHPISSRLIPKCQSEWAKISYHTCRDENITQQVVIDLLQFFSSCCPPVFLTAQATNQLLSSYQFLTTEVHLTSETINHEHGKPQTVSQVEIQTKSILNMAGNQFPSWSGKVQILT